MGSIAVARSRLRSIASWRGRRVVEGGGVVVVVVLFVGQCFNVSMLHVRRTTGASEHTSTPRAQCEGELTALDAPFAQYLTHSNTSSISAWTPPMLTVYFEQ